MRIVDTFRVRLFEFDGKSFGRAPSFLLLISECFVCSGRVVIIAFIASFAGCSTVHMSSVKNTNTTLNTVVINAGHGGKDSGAYRR